LQKAKLTEIGLAHPTTGPFITGCWGATHQTKVLSSSHHIYNLCRQICEILRVIGTQEEQLIAGA